MKKIVMKINLHDDKAKQKAMKAVSTLPGVDSIAIDMKDQKLTVIGAVDPVDVIAKVRKQWSTAEILSVGPAKEPEKNQQYNNYGSNKQQGGGDHKKEGGGFKQKDPQQQYNEEMFMRGNLNAAVNNSNNPYMNKGGGYYSNNPYSHNPYYNQPQPLQYQQQPHHYAQSHAQYRSHSSEEDPNSCVVM